MSGTDQATPSLPEVSKRAAAVAKGLVRTERAAKGRWFDQGMMRLDCVTGGFYWISLDGSRVLKGDALVKADELQPKFIDVMARAGG